MTAPRTYRFAPRDTGGWLLGLQAGQCLCLGTGMLVAGALLRAGAGPGALVASVVALVAAFAPVGGVPVHELAPVAAGHLAGLLRGRLRASGRAPDGLGGLRVGEGPEGVGLVLRGGTATGVLRVRGSGFALAERADQERLVALWGEALAGLCQERGPVSAVSWSERAAPAGMRDHLNHLAETGAGGPPGPVHAYLRLVSEAEEEAVGREVLVAVTVDGSRLRRSRRALVEEAAAQLGLLAERLVAAGLDVEPPLSATDLAAALRDRLEPGPPVPPATLAEAVAARSDSGWAPGAWVPGWHSVATGSAHHACWWVAEWPRLEVGPAWLEPLLLGPAGTRTLTVVLEPVAPSRAQRQVDRDSTRLAADEEQRSRAGFRTGARHRRSAEAVAEREQELVAGYAELSFCGLLTVSAPDPDALEADGARAEQAAASAGLELRRLDGRHDAALLASLPAGRGLGRRSLS